MQTHPSPKEKPPFSKLMYKFVAYKLPKAHVPPLFRNAQDRSNSTVQKEIKRVVAAISRGFVPSCPFFPVCLLLVDPVVKSDNTGEHPLPL